MPKNKVAKMMQRRRAVALDLPPFEEIVRGSLITRYRRCGKPNCHCVNSKGHGPAHYLSVTLRPGKTEQVFLSEGMAPVARRYLDNYQSWWKALEKVSAANRRLLRMRAPELIVGEHFGKEREASPKKSSLR